MLSPDLQGAKITGIFPVAVGKILLRPFTLADRSAKSRLDADPDVMKHLGQASCLEVDITEFQRQGYGLVVIEDNETTTVVGYAKLECPKWEENLGLELVIAIAPEVRRRGIALEAARKLIAIACGPLKQRQVVGRVALRNKASRYLVTKLGMTRVGQREDHFDDVQHIYVVSCGQQAV